MINLGIICPSEIAFRRFMPALENTDITFSKLGTCSSYERFGCNPSNPDTSENVLKKQHDKARQFVNSYGGKIADSYESLVTSEDINAVYIPLPPSLHYKWAKLALDNGKHVILEKPATISSEDTKELVRIARQKKLALHENYMFAFHNQLTAINDMIAAGEIGDVRLYRIAFGFPRRKPNDFRYHKHLGGGALYDAGGYTIKYASMLLGESAKIVYAQMNYIDEFQVDIYGSAAFVNKSGTTVQVAYGMDNSYKCELEVWGSNGCLTANRVLTAPPGLHPELIIRKGGEPIIRKLPEDDTFSKSIIRFSECINNEQVRQQNYEEMITQSELMDNFYSLAKVKIP